MSNLLFVNKFAKYFRYLLKSTSNIMQNKTEIQRLVNQELRRFHDKLNAQKTESGDGLENENNIQLESNGKLIEELQQWYHLHNPSEQCVDDLLQILNNQGLGVPISVKCLQSDATISNPWSKQTARDIKNENCKDTNCAVTDIQAQQKRMNAKLKLMMEEIAKAKVQLDLNEGMTDAINKSSESFPIKTKDDLVAFERSINDSNINMHVLSLKGITRNESMKTSLSRILSERILFDHNYDGRNNKLAINAYPKFLNILFRVYDDLESHSDFTRHLKVAMKRVKNRYHKLKWQKKHNKHNKSVPDDVNEDEDDDFEDDEYYN